VVGPRSDHFSLPASHRATLAQRDDHVAL
jgi:hypothetical protein